MLFTERRDGRDQLSVGTDFKQQPGLLNAELPDFNPAGGQSAEAGVITTRGIKSGPGKGGAAATDADVRHHHPFPAGLKLPKKHQTKISLQGGLDSLVRLRESQNSVATARKANTLPAIIAMRTAFLLMLRSCIRCTIAEQACFDNCCKRFIPVGEVRDAAVSDAHG